MEFKTGYKVGIGDRNFRRGDKYDSNMNKGTIYIFDNWETLPNPALLYVQGDKKARGSLRFILANDFTELELIIYGVTL